MIKPLLTKVKPPVSGQLLHRPRLLTRLENYHKYRLLLISAGTGFGKTSLLVDFAHSSQINLAWYTLDETDQDLAIFCNYLLHSLRQIHPTFGQAFEKLLEENLTQLHQEAIVYRLAQEFIADLEVLNSEIAHKPEDLASQPAKSSKTLLVLDDYQFAESLNVSRFVQHLVWWLPPNFHLILSTRALPENLMLTKLLAKRMMTVIGSGELAFTAEEINQLLGEFYQLNRPELAEMLTTYSEGWITAVILALNNRNFTADDSQLNLKATPVNFKANELFAYLADEVLQNQTVEMQNFLLKTSVLNLVTPATCAKLLETEIETEITLDEAASEAILKQLEARNLFITHLENNNQTFYQYHSLFRQFLQSRLRQNQNLYAKLHIRAAQLQEEAGNQVEAVQHYMLAGQLAQAAKLLNSTIQQLYATGRTGFIAALLDTIPEEEQNKLPDVLNVKARLLLEQGDNQLALEIYGKAEQLYRQTQQTGDAARVAARQAEILLRVGQRRQAEQICAHILYDASSLMQTSAGQQAIASVRVVAAVIAIETGNGGEAEKELRAAAEIYKTSHDNFNLALVDSYFGQLYHNNGRLLKSNIYYERALAYVIKTGNSKREVYIRTSLAINHYLQGQYQLAEKQITETLTLAEKLNDTYLQLFGLTYLGNIYRETERYTKANTIYQQALELARQGQVRKMELVILNDQATNFILEGKKEEARRQIRLALELTEDYNLPERAALCYRNQSWLEYDNRTFKNALTSMEKALVVFENYNNQAEISRTKLGVAVVLMAMGEVRRALSALNESLQQSHELGFDPFLPYELNWATKLFEHASRKKVNEPLEDFLRRRGFISEIKVAPDILPLASFKNATLETAQETSKASDSWQKLPAPQDKTLLNTDQALRVFALNRGRVWLGDTEIEKWRTSKAREVLFYLLENGKCTRDELLEALWPDEDFQTSSHLLRTNLFLLRKAIAPVELKFTTGRYYLEGQVWYDAAEFDSEINLTLAAKTLDVRRLTAALAFYKRDFLDQFYSNWSLERQQQLQQLFLNAMGRLANYYQQTEQPQLALTVWRQLLIKDPYNEIAHQSAITCLLAMNNKAEARRQSAQYLKALEELDLQPSPETTHLLKRLA